VRLLFVIGLCVASQLCAQRIELVEGSSALQVCMLEEETLTRDSALVVCLQRLRREGYLEAAIDSVSYSGDTVRYHAHQGPLYEVGAWASRSNPSTTHGPVRTDTLTSPRKLADLTTGGRAYIQTLGREGYPFGRVRVDSINLDSTSVSGRTTVWSGPRIRYGGVEYADGVEPPVSETYLERYLRVESGRLYRSQEIEQAGRRLRTLSFVTVRRDPVVVFETGDAVLYVDAVRRKTSRFDFLLGFLPNSEANNGQLLLTGDLTLELENALRRGERLFVSFERLQPESTELEAEVAYPYLLDSPFGGRGRFELYRQQDDWLRINYELGGDYAFGGGDGVELFYAGGQAQVLAFDTARVERTLLLPDVLDARRNGFGLRLRIDRRDDILDTRSGRRLQIEGNATLRSVTVPSFLTELSQKLEQQADSLGGQTAQYRGSIDVEQFLPLGRRTTLALRFRGAGILGVQTPLRNELHRIGGNRLLRGFDEQSIDAQHYAIGSVEYRLLIGGGSYLFAFADQGTLFDPYRSGDRYDQPTGFGAGLRLGTRSGALALTYAYGRRTDAPIDWQRAKVHIGFESRF